MQDETFRKQMGLYETENIVNRNIFVIAVNCIKLQRSILKDLKIDQSIKNIKM